MPRLNDLGHGRIDVPKLDPRDIVVRNGFNYREIDSEVTQKHIAWLAESIKASLDAGGPGIEKPLSVEYDSGKAYLVDGQCRLLAALKLWRDGTVKMKYPDGSMGPVLCPVVQVKGDEANVLAHSMIANGSLPPNQVEFGAAVARLLAYGWSIEDVARFTPPHIRVDMKKAVKYSKDALTLHEAPVAVKEAVKKGVEVDGKKVEVSPALAVSAVRHGKLTAMETIGTEARKAVERGQKAAKRPKGKGKATKAKEAKETLQDRLYALGDSMASEIIAEGIGGPLKASAQAWKQLRGR